MRKLALAFLLFALAAAPALPAAAAPQWTVFAVDKTYYLQDGRQVKMDSAPFVAGGRTYLPIRYLAYALGITDGDIRWDGRAQLLTLIKGAYTVTLRVGSKTLYSSSGKVSMDAAPVSKNGHVYLPAAYVAAAFGYRLDWNPADMSVTVAPRETTFLSAPSRGAVADLRSGQYVVQSGDSLLLIARRFGLSISDLLAANAQVNDANHIYPGQVLNIPAGVTRHVVARGETLSQIAADYHIPPQEIMNFNPQIKRADLLYPGQILLLPDQSALAAYY
ncbi:LysM peptidoglycan-binding domain-containing protein [Desulfotomaculum copahuensis]|uniref:LysM domain-containing protein n=1 Tax=Desulfotomaculum copahuensis TaxID=1838280 RepID=A0A1B7LHQ0_9FIRM|nr:stalk domain-containing protein [Desulfotomaculum copahuensis]OAT85721.1 hypothetical protein A6M21_17185 [Desulfotomaculum copahuensis]